MSENLEKDVRDLKRRVNFLEKEVRIFTPPISALSLELMEFRADMNQRFNASEEKSDGKFNTLEGKFDALIEIARDIQGRLTELLEK